MRKAKNYSYGETETLILFKEDHAPQPAHHIQPVDYTYSFLIFSKLCFQYFKTKKCMPRL